MGDMIFHNSYPRQWRLILRGFTFFSMALAFALAVMLIRSAIDGSELLPTYIIFVAMIPGYFVHLLRSAISNDGTDANDHAFFSTILICACILMAVSAMYFKHTESVKQDARLQWTVSTVCSSDGQLRSDIRDECLRLMAHSQTRLCIFGRTPMGACEAELRQKLNRPVGWKPGHASRN